MKGKGSMQATRDPGKRRIKTSGTTTKRPVQKPDGRTASR